MKPVRIGEAAIGPGHPCFLVAEVGINHNGDLDLAHQSIDAAADAGADAVKFQNYRTEDFIVDRTLTYEYVSAGKRIVETQYEMFKRCELSPDRLAELKRHCDKRGVTFFSTPSSEEGVQTLVDLDVKLLKNGSDYLVHLPLVRAMARSGLAAVLSTGMATAGEIDDAVRAFREAGGSELILLHCTSSYPTPPGDVHLRNIPTLSAAYGCPVGFSDHTEGTVAALGAVAVGACFLEKHFTVDRHLPGPDHRFSSDPAEFEELAREVRNLEESLGGSVVGPTPSEEAGRRDYRLSCVAARDLPAGHRLGEPDVIFARPGTGLPPKWVQWLIGRSLAREVKVGHPIDPSDLA
jgi:N,N'-diacetyllegionaminate synthase